MMKLRPFDRFLLALCLLLVVFAGLMALLVGAGALQTAFVQMFNLCMAHWYNRLVLCLVSLAFALCAVRVLISLSAPGEGRVETVTLKTTENGQINLSLEALDTLVQKSVRGHAAVREVRSAEAVGEHGEVRISLRLGLVHDAVVPEVCQAVQAAVREYVQQKAGLNVAEVEILVYQVGAGTLARVD